MGSYQTVALLLPLSRNNMGRTLAFLLLCCAAVAWSAHFEDNPSESDDAWIETQSIPKAIPKEAKALVDALLEAQAKALLEAQGKGDILTTAQEQEIKAARQKLTDTMA